MKSNIMNKYLQLVILSVLPYQLHTQGLGHGLGQGQGRGPGMWRGQGHGGGRGWGQGQGQGQGQGVRCPTSCEIGQTCAMVRHGNNPPAPGCISMQEAILLNQALNGAPTGPGTGITLGQSRQQQTPSFNFQPQQNFNTPPAPPQTIPGVNFLGDGVLGRRFEDRFRSAAGPQPIPQQGGVWRQPDGFNGVLPGSINQDQSIPPGFIDPTVGDPFRNRGFGVDGGLNTRHSHASHGNSIRGSRSGGFNRNTNPWNALSGGGGNTPVTSRNEFPDCMGPFAWCPPGSECRSIPTNEYFGGFVYRCIPFRQRYMNPLTSPMRQNQGITRKRSDFNIAGSQPSNIAIDQAKLVKTQGVQRKEIPRNGRTRQGTSSNSKPIATIKLSSVNRQPNDLDRSSPIATIGNGNTMEVCIPCAEKADCAGLFSYCIPRAPCIGTVCHNVTQA